MIARTPLRELLERVHTVANVAEHLAMTDQDVRDVLMGTAMGSLRKIADQRATQTLKLLATSRKKAKR